MKTDVPLDVLADRYASQEMVSNWGTTGKVIAERHLWLATLCAQEKLGMEVPDGAIDAYRSVIEIVDLEAIKALERRLKHDVKARIEVYNKLAGGHQLIHRGFTARDLTDNVEQLQIFRAVKLARDRAVALLRRLLEKAMSYALLDTCGRSHNVPGQVTTLGKRFANWAEELLVAFGNIQHVIDTYPLRGIKGAMGTQQDMIDLLGGKENAIDLEYHIREHLGVPRVFDSVGQVYPRSLDFWVVSVLAQLSSAPSNFARTVRLMAGHELMHEGFGDEQVGSTAMPHKTNSRTCERVNGFGDVVCGFHDMTSRLLGNQWYEGDVSCSIVRRVALPGAFFAFDGQFESAMTVLDQMQVFPEMVKHELHRYLPFLSTTKFLMAAVQRGMGREDAHKVIKTHAVAAVTRMREGSPVSLPGLLAADDDFPLNGHEIETILAEPDHGAASEQVHKVCTRITRIMKLHPEAATYDPAPIL